MRHIEEPQATNVTRRVLSKSEMRHIEEPQATNVTRRVLSKSEMRHIEEPQAWQFEPKGEAVRRGPSGFVTRRVLSKSMTSQRTAT
jgi:predicted nucleic acid binding AN1-type Zn finger protein